MHFFLLFLLFFGPWAEARLALSTWYTYYLTPTSWKNQFDHYMNIDLNFKQEHHSHHWFSGSELEARFPMDKSYQNHLAVPNVFMGWTNSFKGTRFNFIFGRHKRTSPPQVDSTSSPNETKGPAVEEPWSAMDELWNMGLWQGRINWDYFQPKQEGLTGMFFTLERPSWLFSLFLSGLFFPEPGPLVDIKEGEISSHSRWFLPPQSEFVAFNQRIEALYWLNMPYLKNIIMNESMAFRLRFGDREKHWFSMAYGYKPINQVYFKIDSTFSIDKKAINNVIHYQPFRHSLVSMDFGMKKNIFHSILSITQEIIHRPPSPGEGLVPVLPNALFFSAHTALNFKKYMWPVESLSLDFIYSHFTPQKRDKSQQELDLDLNTNRFKMHHGLAFSAKSRPFQWNQQALSLDLSYWYSIPEQGGWLNTAIKWQMSSSLSFSASMDIVGVDKPKVKSFFNSYKQNDRFQAKVNYVFD